MKTLLEASRSTRLTVPRVIMKDYGSVGSRVAVSVKLKTDHRGQPPSGLTRGLLPEDSVPNSLQITKLNSIRLTGSADNVLKKRSARTGLSGHTGTRLHPWIWDRRRTASAEPIDRTG